MSKKKTLKELQAYGLYKQRKDFGSPGTEIEVGSSGVVSLESLSVLERIIERSTLIPVAFLEEGVLRQKTVARLPKYDPNNPLGQPWGTGFLVSNSLIMTNHHVIGSIAEAKDILVQFNYQTDMNGVAQSIDTWRLDPDAFFYSNAALDFALVRVKGKPFLKFPLKPLIMASISEIENVEINELISMDLSLARTLLQRYPGWTYGFAQLSGSINYAANELLNIVQHPAGRMKEIAIQENTLMHIFSDRIHYTTDTEPGSSGSPVFNNNWDLVALHHAAGDLSSTGTWLDNEGIRIDSIVAHLHNQFATSNPGLLTELGI